MEFSKSITLWHRNPSPYSWFRYTSKFNFEDIRHRIEELFGGGALFNFNKVPGKLGIIVRRPSSGSFITIQALVNNEYIDAITFFSKNKDGSNGHSIGIYNFDKGKQDYYDNIKDIEKRINDFIDFLTKRVEINRTESVVTNKTSTGNTPKFFSRKDGKFIIHLGGQDFVYKNYGDFIIQNEGFTTNVDGSKGSFTIGYLNEDSLTIDAVVRDSSEAKQVNNTDVSDLLFADLSDNRKTVKTEDVLRAAGVDNDTIKVLRGKSIGKTLVTDTVRPDKKDKDDAYAYYDKDDKHIYITSKGAAVMNGNPRNAIRLILHENIHRLFNDNSNLTDAQRQRIIRELKEVYNYTIAQLEKDKDSGKINYKTYAAIINCFNKATSNNNDSTNMEEFLMECLTQKVIAEYLNNTEYHSEVNIDGIPKTKKSIFQKLMDILLNLLGINNQRIKNNSILAREYMILSRTSNNTDAGLFNKPTTNITTDITPIKPVEPIIDDNKLPGEDSINRGDPYIPDDIDTKFDDDIVSFARTEIIEDSYTKEERDILNNAPRDSQGRLLAPNGKPSNLTEKQYVQVRTKAFINWFGDWINDPENASKVVDENGEPLVVYHGSKNNTFNIFDVAKNDKGKKGFFFTNSMNMASSYGSTRGFFLNLKEPYIINGNGENWNNILVDTNMIAKNTIDKIRLIRNDLALAVEKGSYPKENYNYFYDKYFKYLDIYNNLGNSIIDKIKKALIVNKFNKLNLQGHYLDSTRKTESILEYDTDDVSMIFKDITDYGPVFNINSAKDMINKIAANVYVTTNPNQIKSATDNIGTFDKTDNNIYHAKTDLIQETTAAEIYATPIANGATDNAFGVRVVNNLSEFVNSFPMQYRASIQQILAENELNFTCQ